MNFLSDRHIKTFNFMYQTEYLSFSSKGLTLHYKGLLKKCFEDCGITNLFSLSENLSDIRDFVFIKNGLDDINLELDNFSGFLGLTEAPAIFIGFFDEPRYAFAYFNNYQVLDFVEELLSNKEVTFESFLNFKKN